jgi:plastocyanin
MPPSLRRVTVMRLRGLLVLTAAVATVVAPAALGAIVGPLQGTVGPDFNINLEDETGATVTKLDPGTFQITVRDQSPDHNFHLFGPGVNQTTDVEESATVTWTVTFRDGNYTLQCDPHAGEGMRRRFVSGNPPPEPTPTPEPVKLLATVGPKNTISLRRASGAAFKTLKAGSYAITVRDRTKVHNFHLVGKGVNRKTGKAAVGTFTWNVKLAKGPLRFFSDQSPTKVKGSVTVG